MGTLFEKWTKKKNISQPIQAIKPEQQIYNPLNASRGDGIKVATLDDEDYDYHVIGLREVKLDGIAGESANMIDYDILARGTIIDTSGSPDINVEIKKRLRFVPLENKETRLTHSVLLLKFVTEFSYDKAYETDLNSPPNAGEKKEVGEPVLGPDGQPKVDNEGNQILDVFERVNGLTTAWTAHIKQLDSNQTTKRTITYWDYWRETKIDGVDVLEFYIIEMDGTKEEPESGQFQIWRGQEIEQNRIKVI